MRYIPGQRPQENKNRNQLYRSRFDNMDAGESMFFARQLEFIRGQTYDIKLIELKARMLIPVDNSVPPGATSVTFRQFTPFGAAKIVASYADDFPRATAKGVEVTQNVVSIGASFGYNVQEIRGAMMAGLPLEQREANTARRAVESKIDLLAQLGDAPTGMVGFLNQPNALIYTVPNGAGGFATWSTKTALEISADLAGIANFIVTTTKEVEKPDTLLCPLGQYGIIATKPMSSTAATNETVLSFFLKTNPYIKEVEPWYAMSGIGSGATDRMCAYRRDPDALVMVIPQEFEQFAPEQHNMEFTIPCHARYGGVQYFYPLSQCYGDGI